MATPKDIGGANVIYRAPAEDADRVGDLKVFANRGGLTSAWHLSDAELAEIVRTRTVYLNVMGHTLPPVFVGSESQMRALSLDMGGVLPPQEPAPDDIATGLSEEMPRTREFCALVDRLRRGTATEPEAMRKAEALTLARWALGLSPAVANQATIVTEQAAWRGGWTHEERRTLRELVPVLEACGPPDIVRLRPECEADVRAAALGSLQAHAARLIVKVEGLLFRPGNHGATGAERGR